MNTMGLKEKSKKELEQRIDELEDLIANKGIGSDYLSKAERVQRDLNLAVVLGGAATVLGVTAYALYKFRGE